MKGQIIKKTIEFECLCEEDCYYKNPQNKYSCVGCRFARVISQTPPVLVNRIITEQPNKFNQSFDLK